MKRSHATRALIISATIAILLAVGYTWWWISFAYGARAGVERWAEERRRQGWQVSFDDITLRGYPFVLNMRLRQPHIAEPGRFDWRGSDVVASISPLTPNKVQVRAAGKHQIGIVGIDSVAFEAGTANVKVDLNLRGLPTGGTALLQNVTATSSAGTSSIDSLQIQIEEMTPPASRVTEAVPNNIGFGVALSNLSLPSQLKLPISRRIATATLRGRVRGQWEPVAFTTALANWRDGGGVIEMDELMLRWDPLTMSANGTMALDQRLQPLIAVSARLTGFFETVDALSAAHVIRSRDVSMAKLMLGLLSKPSANGGPAVLELPLTVQDGTFYAGPAAIAKIPDLPWEAPAPVPIPGLPAQVKREDLAKPGMTVGPQGEVTRAK